MALDEVDPEIRGVGVDVDMACDYRFPYPPNCYLVVDVKVNPVIGAEWYGASASLSHASCSRKTATNRLRASCIFDSRSIRRFLANCCDRRWRGWNCCVQQGSA